LAVAIVSGFFYLIGTVKLFLEVLSLAPTLHCFRIAEYLVLHSFPFDATA